MSSRPRVADGPFTAADPPPLSGPETVPRWLSGVEGAALTLLLAVAGTIAVGYRFGDSNHGITVPILKRAMDPGLYPGDVMVATGETFPTVFYRLMALLLPGTGAIPAAFFVLYLASIAATLGAAWRIGRWAGGPPAAALALAFAFPVRIGLAGEALYRVAFSHSHVASALTLWAIVWFLEGRRLLPLLVLSLGAYNHLLYSAYVLVPMTLVVLWEHASLGAGHRPADRPRLLRLLAAAVLPLVPIALWSVSRGTPMTGEWLELLKLRSAHHSFPSSFGSDLPAAAALLGLALLAVPALTTQGRTLFAFFLLGTAVQFVFGSLFTEAWPVKAVLQYQPHRVWRFLLVILYGVIATGAVRAWGQGVVGRVVAVVTAALVLVPGLEPYFPLALFLQAATGRPTREAWPRLAVVALLPFLRSPIAVDYTYLPEMLPRLLHEIVFTALALGLLVLVAREQSPRARTRLTLAAALLSVVVFVPYTFWRMTIRWEEGDWREVQDWARQATPKTAVFLTPPRESGFRVFSERTVVGEWKDGTQQYFDDAFVKEWGARMRALAVDRYPRLTDDQLVEIAGRYGATHVVLPARPRRRSMPLLYSNASFAVYAVPRP